MASPSLLGERRVFSASLPGTEHAGKGFVPEEQVNTAQK